MRSHKLEFRHAGSVYLGTLGRLFWNLVSLGRSKCHHSEQEKILVRFSVSSVSNFLPKYFVLRLGRLKFWYKIKKFKKIRLFQFGIWLAWFGNFG